MTSLATDNLAELIRKKQQVLLQLRDIGLKQQHAVDSADTSGLLQLLGAKQHLIAALQLVERHLRPFQAEDPEQRVWRSAQDRQACAKRAEECNQLLKEVMDLERQQELRMVEHRDRVAARLKQAGTAQRAVGAYAQQRSPQPRTPMLDSGPASTSIDLTSNSH
ncbi:hypothetical protein [Aeoliella mucimassa]|uniref:FlgN protein n=1 Tax=Aeoliella mucimassa TaxID=2527972 RepID=A0A518AKS4_9BACT|nr:hypothetical protein [Aeoliella mucimassa]QDU55327.1 FlgN protein [Aeoliella mucimassa]